MDWPTDPAPGSDRVRRRGFSRKRKWAGPTGSSFAYRSWADPHLALPPLSIQRQVCSVFQQSSMLTVELGQGKRGLYENKYAFGFVSIEFSAYSVYFKSACNSMNNSHRWNFINLAYLWDLTLDSKVFNILSLIFDCYKIRPEELNPIPSRGTCVRWISAVVQDVRP